MDFVSNENNSNCMNLQRKCYDICAEIRGFFLVSGGDAVSFSIKQIFRN
jgi:hypothetical protein